MTIKIKKRKEEVYKEPEIVDGLKRKELLTNCLAEIEKIKIKKQSQLTFHMK